MQLQPMADEGKRRFLIWILILCSFDFFNNVKCEPSCLPGHLPHGPMSPESYCASLTTFLTSRCGVKRLGRPAMFSNMKTAYCSYSYQLLTPWLRSPLCSAPDLSGVALPCRPMTCCVTLVCNTALSLIRGYFIT